MSSFFEYGIKSGIALTVFYLFYWFALRNDTNFRMNRFVLMISLIFSMILPFLSSLIRVEPVPGMTMAINFSSSGGQEGPPVITNDAPLVTWNIWKILSAVYFAGALLVFARLVYQAIYLHAISRLSKTEEYDGFKVISLDTDMVPFSYFNKIFIPSERIEKESIDSVIMHEKSHLRQGHFVDLFIFQFISVLQWFNPFIWFFEKSLKEVHEYLADEAVLQTCKNPGKYQAILVNQALGGPVFLLTNQFNQSLIKKRIMMMKNKQTKKTARYKALLLVPLMAGLMFAFANPDVISQSGPGIVVKGKVTDRFSGLPAAGANILVKGSMTGTVTDLDGNYKITVNSSEDKLLFTSTGYRTEEQIVGRNAVINIQLEPDIMAIEFNKGNRLTGEKTANVNENKKAKENESNNGGGFVFIEELPSYPGGTDALRDFIIKNLKYPEKAKNAGVEGVVLVTYIIDANGKIKSPKVIRGLEPEIDSEALRITGLISGWKPANQGGRPVPTTVTMPVEFSLK
jgi:TonB family protein